MADMRYGDGYAPTDPWGKVAHHFCRDCGGVVADKTLHDLWHIRIDALSTITEEDDDKQLVILGSINEEALTCLLCKNLWFTTTTLFTKQGALNAYAQVSHCVSCGTPVDIPRRD